MRRAALSCTQKNGPVKPAPLGEAKLDSFMLPKHVCTVMGYEEYERSPFPGRKNHEKASFLYHLHLYGWERE
jgi:hypothetical protein